jgi:hypothetical protein
LGVIHQVHVGRSAYLNEVGEQTLAFACRHRTQAVVTCFLDFDEVLAGVCDPSTGAEEAPVELEPFGVSDEEPDVPLILIGPNDLAGSQLLAVSHRREQ